MENDVMFFKIVADRRHVTHVTKLTAPGDLEAVKPFLRQAYADSLARDRST
jgi:hypothetical protein